MIIVVDDEDRENEGDLTMAASKVTPEAINFMVKHGRGLVCLAMTPERLDRARDSARGLRQLVARARPRCACRLTRRPARRRAFRPPTARGPSRSRSARRRSRSDLARPGHVFPLRARSGGVLVRAGHTEAAVDLARIAGLAPAGVICEVMNDDGSMARVPELTKFARKHGLLMITIADLIRYRMRTEGLVRRVATASLADGQGPFTVHAYDSLIDGQTHVALVRGDIGDGKNVLVRVHSKCLTGDVFHSTRCDCGPQLDAALARLAQGGARRAPLSPSGRPGHRAGEQDSAPTRCRIRGSTPSRPTSGSGSSRTSAITESARRSCATSASGRCGC